MDGLREWAIAVCAVSVLGAAITLLVPDDRSEKLMNMCVSVLVLIVAVSPLAKLGSCTAPVVDIPEETADSNMLNECIEEQTVMYLSQTAQQLTAARLAEDGIIPKEISVSMDSSENGCISIGQVTVTLDITDIAKAESVRQMIVQWLGTENVYVTGGTNGEDKGNS